MYCLLKRFGRAVVGAYLTTNAQDMVRIMKLYGNTHIPVSVGSSHLLWCLSLSIFVSCWMFWRSWTIWRVLFSLSASLQNQWTHTLYFYRHYPHYTPFTCFFEFLTRQKLCVLPQLSNCSLWRSGYTLIEFTRNWIHSPFFLSLLCTSTSASRSQICLCFFSSEHRIYIYVQKLTIPSV